MGDSEAQYEFSSPPTVPREKVGDILVKFQAVSPTDPCLLVKSYRLSSKAKVLDVRRKIQSEFDNVFENGFVFLCKNTEILTSRERTLSLKDILPKAGLGKPYDGSYLTKSSFLYPPDVSYKKLTFDRDGRGYTITCIGLLFLCDASGVSHWNNKDLRQRLDAHSTFGFTFIPSDITSARADVNESLIEELNQYAAVSQLEIKKKHEGSDDEPDETTEQDKRNFDICKEKIEKLLKTSKFDEEKLKDRRLATPLHYAAQGGHLKMCQFLCMRLDKAKLLYEKDLHGRTPLHCALSRIGVKSRRKHLKVVAYLLTYICDPDTLNSSDGNDLSCYSMILSLKKEDTIFLMKQLDPDMIDQKLVLHFCCCALQYRELSEALRYCESVSVVKPTFLRPPLHLAAEFGNRDIIVKLLNADHKVLDRDPDGHLPFHYACHHGNSEFIKLLYHEDMEVEDVEKGVRLALFRKKFNVLGEIAEVALIIQLDSDLRQTLLTQAEQNLKKHGKSILSCLMKGSKEQKNENVLALSRFVSQAASLGLTDLLQDLLKVCPPTYSDEMSRTSLHEAVQGSCFMKGDAVKRSKRQSNCFLCFKSVLHETKVLDVVDWRSSTPLHYACMEGNVEVVRFMLTKKDLKFASMQDSVGRTPLIIAAHYQKGRKTLDFLINHHVEQMKPYTMDMYGKNILHYIGYMKSGLVDVLLDKMKKLEDDSTGPYQPRPFPVPSDRNMHLASQTSNVITEFLLETEGGQKKCRYCDQDLKEQNGTHLCLFLFQTQPANTELSPLETLIVMDRPGLLKKLVKDMPSLLEGDKGLKATFCAVKMWRLGCAEVLIKGFRKDRKYLDKYLLAALENKPAMVLVQQNKESATNAERCRLASLKMRPSKTETESQFLMVKYLLKMGASTCHIPHQFSGKVGSKINNIPSLHPLNKDIPGSLRRYCSALEKAVIVENKGVIELLLEQPQTRIRGSFAVHLAAKAGNVELLEKFLQKMKKEELAFGDDDTELAFVSTLPNGILGAACASEKASFALFEVIYKLAPKIFKGTKLMTAKLLTNSRPVMLDILKIHDFIPLVLFIRKQHQHMNLHEKERIVCYILQKGSYPTEMRIRKKSYMHPVCDIFIAALQKKMWKVLAILLDRSGATLWKCIFGANEDKIKCHQRLCYWDSSSQKSNLTTILGHFTYPPVEIVSMFTHAGLKTITTLDQYVKEDLLEEEFTKYKDDEKNMQTLFLERVVFKLWDKPTKALLSKHKGSKKSIPDHSFSQTKDMWIPSFVNCETMSLTKLQSVSTTIQHISLPLLDQIVHVRKRAMFKKEKTRYKSLERGLIHILQHVRPSDRDRPALWLAVAFGDRNLAEYIIKSRNGISLTDEENELNLLDLAARKADLPMIKVLIKHGAVPTDLTLQYASGLLRKCFMKVIWNYTDPYLADPCAMKWYGSESEEDQVRLGSIKYMCESISDNEKDSSPKYTHILEMTAKSQKWALVDYLLDMGVTVLDLPDGGFTDNTEDQNESYAESAEQNMFNACECLMEILSNASPELALKALRKIGDVKWNKLSLYFILTTTARSNKVLAVKYLLQEVLFRSSSPLDTPDDVAEVLSKPVTVRGRQFGAALHSLCQHGDIENVKIILMNLKCESIEFINVLDEKLSTPLWYAASFGHWRLAELLLLNGATVVNSGRAVAGFSPIRTGYSQPEKKARITSLKQFPGISNDSRHVAVAIKSKADVFLKPQELMKMKQKFKSDAHIFHTKYPTRRPPKPSMAKRVQVLMEMAMVGNSLEGTIFHAALLDGDIALIKEIQSQPMFDRMIKTSKGLSAGVLAFANQTAKIIKECRRYPNIMGEPAEIVKRASQVMISLAHETFSEILKLRNKEKNEQSKMTEADDQRKDSDHDATPFVHSLCEILVTNYMEGNKLRYFSFPCQISAEHLAKEVMDLLTLSADQTIPNEFLVALAVLSKPKLFTHLEDKLKTNQRQTDVTTRNIMEGCTITDLIILLSSQKDIKEICQSLEDLARIGVLHINDKVLMFTIRRNMTSALRIIAESIYSKIPEGMLSKPWLDVFVFAASKGDNALLKILMKGLNNYSSRKLNDALDKAISASSSKGYSDVVEILTTFASKKGILKELDLQEALKQAAKYGRVQVAKQLFKICQKIQKLDINLLIKILKRTKFSGSRTFFQTVLDFGTEAFRAEKDKITNVIPTVLLQSAKRGHEQICLYILEKYPDVNLKQKSKDRKKEVTVKGQKRVTNQNNKDATTLHYACERGSLKLVLKILEKDPKLAEIEDRDKRHPIQYAKAMGKVAVLQEMSLRYGMTTMEEARGEIQYFGWLRHCITKNAEIRTEDLPVTARLNQRDRFSKCYWNVENALEHKDEKAALSMFYAAEGDLMDMMEKKHRGPIHQASKFGCSKFLVVIFERFKNDSDILKTILMTEVDGRIPLALAVQGKHTECVKLLNEKHDATQWKSSETKETIFHFAAITNDVAILDMLLQDTDQQRGLATNSNSMTPALYSLALGHHHLVSRFLKQGYPQNPKHSSHKETDYTCHECILDRCVGWSKLYLSQQHVSQPPPPRDIWESRQATIGFISEGDTMTHVLERLLEYATMSKNTIIVQNALVCMGYESTVDMARLFLLQSIKGNHVDSVRRCLAQGWGTTVVALLKYLDKKESEDFFSQVLDLAVAAASMEVVKYVIQEYPTLVYSKELMGFTSLEVAISMQRYDVYEVLLSKVPQDAVQGCFNNLPDIKISIPYCAQYLTGISHPGEERWLESIQESRFPDANCIMLHNGNSRLKEKVETTSKLDSMFPDKISNLPLTVDIESFKRGCPVQVTDSWLMSVVASYLQTLKSVLEEAKQLQEVDVVELSCLPSSNKVPFMEISGRSLRDRVKLEKVDSSGMREPLLFIKGSERHPNKLHNDAHFKKMVDTEIIPEAEDLAADIIGHRVRVKVDWPSFSAEHTEDTKTTVYNILAGRDPHSALGGLLDGLKLCKDMCDDIHALHGDETMKSVQDLLVPLKEIVVKHSVSLSKASKTMFCLIDQSMVWFVNYKNDYLVYQTSNFPLYCVLKSCHSVCVNMSGGLREFELEVVKHSSCAKEKEMRIEPHIDWKSFGSIGDTTALSVLGRNGIRLEMLRLAAGFKHLMWYDVFTRGRPNMFVLKNVSLASQSELTIDEGTVTLSMYAARSHNAGWVSTGLDIYSRLQDLEIKWLLEENSYENIAETLGLPKVLESFGLNISVPHENKKWFEEIARRENRQMSHPIELLELYIKRVKSIFRIREVTKTDKTSKADAEIESSRVGSVNSSGQSEEKKEQHSHEKGQEVRVTSESEKKEEFEQKTGLEEMLMKSLTLCPGVWPVQRMESPPGLWFWVTIAELQNGISYDKFMVKAREREGRIMKTFYKVMSKQKACMLDPQRVSGVWYYQSFDKKTDTKTIKQLQLMSFCGMIYFISDPLTVQGVLQMIPSTIRMTLCTTEVEEDDDTFYVQLGSWDNEFSLHTRLMNGFHKIYVDNKAIYDCWNRGSELGINVVIDTDDIREGLFGCHVVEQIAEGTLTSLEQFIQKDDMKTQRMCSNLLSSQGVLLVGRTNLMEDEKTAWTAEGKSSIGEYVTIYPLSEADIFVCYEKALDCLTESQDKENPVYISSAFPKVLNHAFGHKVTQTARVNISTTLKDMSTRSFTVDISFLEPSSEDIFIPQAQLVMDNITTVFTYLASLSRTMKEMMTRNIKEVCIRKKHSDNDFNIARFHKEVLTIFAVNKEMPLPLEHIAKAMLEALDVEMSSMNGMYNEKFLQLKPVGYSALCPTLGSNSFLMKVTDVTGNELNDERLQKFKLKNLKIVFAQEKQIEDIVESTATLLKNNQELKVDCRIHLDEYNSYTRTTELYYDDKTASVHLGESKLLGPVRLCRKYIDRGGVTQGKSPHQIVLTQVSNQSFLVFSDHEHICWGNYTELTAPDDKHQIPGNCIRNVYTSGKLIFELTYAAEFGTYSNKRYTVKWLSSNLYSVRIQSPRQRVFLRTRCKQCTSYLHLYTKVSSVPAGAYLEVVCAPSSETR